MTNCGLCSPSLMIRRPSLSPPNSSSTKLKKAGIRGRPGSACHCPVANYVAKKLTGHRVSASLSFIRVWELSAFGSYDGRPLAECRTPDRIKDFIEAFDQGNYVDLQVN